MSVVGLEEVRRKRPHDLRDDEEIEPPRLAGAGQRGAPKSA